jgi:catechol 2,3-dioxygenase-like lactoylglutathione lyase family enzyme
MIKELNHIGLLTPDMGASVDFYERLLGGTAIRDYRDAAGPAGERIAFFE